MQVLVTGGTGFVGGAVCRALRSAGHRVRVATRRPESAVDLSDELPVAVPDVGPETDWRPALKDVEAVVHLAAHVHVMGRETSALAAAHQRVNGLGTARLAQAAAGHGVRRLVFMSSVKVHGERTRDRPFGESDPLAPEDPYGKSKRDAERMLEAAAEGTGTTWIALRPPLVYGPGVGGNMLKLLSHCRRGLPLPLGSANGRRSLIHVDNLADAVRLSLSHPEARGSYLVRDGEDLSIAELVGRLRTALGVPRRLIPVPPTLLKALAACVGAGASASRLLDSLRVDDARIRRELGWAPPHTVTEGLKGMAAWYRDQS